MVLPALRTASARGGRNRAVRPQLVQPCGCRARDGILHASGIRGILSLGSRIRAHAGPIRDPAAEVLVFDYGRGAALAVSRPDLRSIEAVEVESDGSRIAPSLGGLHQSQGGHAAALAHSRSTMVGGAGSRQEARATQLHRPPAQAVSVRTSTQGAYCSAGTGTSRALFPPGRAGRDARAGDLLTCIRTRARLESTFPEFAMARFATSVTTLV